MKLRKGVQAENYVKKLLRECKTWGGPWTTADELCHILTQKPDKERVIVRTEMAFFAYSHKAEKIARPSLFRLNSISHEEKLENAPLLLSNVDGYATESMASLPTNEDVLRELNKGQRHTQTLAKVPKKHNVNEM